MPDFIPWNKVDLPLKALRSIWISTTRPDGRPHAVPVWFVWDGAGIYFTTPRDTQKANNLAHQPWIVVHAGDGDDVIILEGPSAIVTDQEELNRVDDAYRDKYVDPHSGTRDTVFHENTDLYRVHVKHVMTWEYGIMSTRTDWRFAE